MGVTQQPEQRTRNPEPRKYTARIAAVPASPLLTSEGNVSTIAGDLAASNNAKLSARIGHTIDVTGDSPALRAR